MAGNLYSKKVFADATKPRMFEMEGYLGGS